MSAKNAHIDAQVLGYCALVLNDDLRDPGIHSDDEEDAEIFEGFLEFSEEDGSLEDTILEDTSSDGSISEDEVHLHDDIARRIIQGMQWVYWSPMMFSIKIIHMTCVGG